MDWAAREVAAWVVREAVGSLTLRVGGDGLVNASILRIVVRGAGRGKGGGAVDTGGSGDNGGRGSGGEQGAGGLALSLPPHVGDAASSMAVNTGSCNSSEALRMLLGRCMVRPPAVARARTWLSGCTMPAGARTDCKCPYQNARPAGKLNAAAQH